MLYVFLFSRALVLIAFYFVGTSRINLASNVYIQTDKGYLIYYSYSDSKEFPWSIDLEIPIASIDIAMKAASNISTSSTVSGERMKLAKAVGMYADAQSVTLVFQSGDFWRFDWSGKVCLLPVACTCLSGNR